MQQINYKKFKPVITLSTKGKILVSIVRFYYQIRQWLSKSGAQDFMPDHHEDPSAMKFKEQLYLGQKYYFRAMTKAEQNEMKALLPRLVAGYQKRMTK